MRIWRVEHGVDRYGPYCSGKGRDEVTIRIADSHSRRENMDTHPTTTVDGFYESIPYSESYNWRHGMNRYLHLMDWFKGFADDLRSVGFVVAVYEVPSPHFLTGKSKRQMLFNPSGASLVLTRDLWRE